jgi:hypothetical protein
VVLGIILSGYWANKLCATWNYFIWVGAERAFNQVYFTYVWAERANESGLFYLGTGGFSFESF